MKKFAQTAVLIAGLAGLSACATSDAGERNMDRTAGSVDRQYVDELQLCNERVRRLEEMNKACYRK